MIDERARSLLPEKDPNGIAQHDPGAKLDDGKIRAALLEDFSLALMAVSEVLTYGAEKYSPHGWTFVGNGEERYRDAAWRHLLAGCKEESDRESGLPHEAMVIWNFLAAYELKLRGERYQEKALTPPSTVRLASRTDRVEIEGERGRAASQDGSGGAISFRGDQWGA